MPLPSPSGIVTLVTDFGHQDPYVGIMKGAVLRADRRAQIVDLCHEVPAQDVVVGAFFVRAAVGRFPDGTVHVAIVDPEVGTSRRLLAVCAARCFWIGPDNGVLSAIVARDDAEVRAIDLVGLGLTAESRTFHGRDLFAPCAGFLSGGRFGFRALGRVVQDPVLLPADDAPQVVFVDGFGNLITNVPAAQVQGNAVRVGGREIPLRATYADAEPGHALALINSYGTLEIAVARGSAYELLGVGRGEPVVLLDREIET